MRPPVAALVILLTVSNVHAEERCFGTDTPRQCLQRLITSRAYENVQAGVAARNTGPSAVASPIRSAVKDFLGVASAHFDGSTVRGSGRALTLDYNFRRMVNLEAIFPDPVVSPAVGAMAMAPQRLSRRDDATVSLSFNLVTSRFGRTIDRSLFDSMLLATMAGSAPASVWVPPSGFDSTFVELFPEAATRIAAMEEYETAALAALPPVADKLMADLQRLANNQPQLFGSGLYHHRAAVVGPNEQGFRVTWEIGSDNLNTFRRSEGRDCETRGDCLEAFADYTARTARRHRSRRLALAIQYGTTAVNDIGAGNIIEVATKGLTYMATYGQEIPSFLKGRQGRFDLALTYAGHRATRGFTTAGLNSARRGTPSISFPGPIQRLLPPSSTPESIALTITQPLTGKVSVPISVVLSHHDDWLPGFEWNPIHNHHHETAFHAGVKIDLPNHSRPAPKQSCCCK